jgi:GH35 family endo-1,4-beta-xylanase
MTAHTARLPGYPATRVNGVGDVDTLVKAFKYAAYYAPDTELYYNDFNAWRPEKRDVIEKMINMLKLKGSLSTVWGYKRISGLTSLKLKH